MKPDDMPRCKVCGERLAFLNGTYYHYFPEDK